MKYDLLMLYRDYLIDGGLAGETARTYYIKLDNLLEGQSLTDTVQNLDITKIINKLSEIKYKSHFSQSKNAFLHFCRFQNISLNDEQLEEINSLQDRTRKKYRKLQSLDFGLVQRKITHLKNNKLKLSFQAMIETGLRVSELSQIKPSDCLITDNEITLNFVGKGGKNETVKLCPDDNPKLFNNVKDLINQTKDNKKVFYSAVYLQAKANKLGFHCHDLRRVCAKLEYKKTKSKELVSEKLRHSSPKTTNIYIKYPIDI